MIYSYIYIQAGQPPATYKGVFIMHDFNFEMNQYLTYCRTQKRLDDKTLKAYRIDLTQFDRFPEFNMQFVKRIGDNAVAVVEVVEKGFEGGKLSFHSFRFELFVKS